MKFLRVVAGLILLGGQPVAGQDGFVGRTVQKGAWSWHVQVNPMTSEVRIADAITSHRVYRNSQWVRGGDTFESYLLAEVCRTAPDSPRLLLYDRSWRVDSLRVQMRIDLHPPTDVQWYPVEDLARYSHTTVAPISPTLVQQLRAGRWLFVQVTKPPARGIPDGPDNYQFSLSSFAALHNECRPRRP